MSKPTKDQIYVWFLVKVKDEWDQGRELERVEKSTTAVIILRWLPVNHALVNPFPLIVSEICQYDVISQFTWQKLRHFLDVIKFSNPLSLS